MKNQDERQLHRDCSGFTSARVGRHSIDAAPPCVDTMQQTVTNEDTGLNLRKLVEDVDGSASRQIEPCDVWRALVGGTLCVWRHVRARRSRLLVLQPNQGAPLSTRDHRPVGQSFVRNRPESHRLGLRPRLRDGSDHSKAIFAERLGVSAVPSRAPLLVSLLAQSANNPAVTRALKCFSVSVSNQTYQVVSRELGGSRWESLLSPAELDVVLLLRPRAVATRRSQRCGTLPFGRLRTRSGVPSDASDCRGDRGC